MFVIYAFLALSLTDTLFWKAGKPKLKSRAYILGTIANAVKALIGLIHFLLELEILTEKNQNAYVFKCLNLEFDWNWVDGHLWKSI